MPTRSEKPRNAEPGATQKTSFHGYFFYGAVVVACWAFWGCSENDGARVGADAGNDDAASSDAADAARKDAENGDSANHDAGEGHGEAVTVHPLPDSLSAIDISYLPYEYVRDGCQYRASYLAMELAARDIPSFVYVVEDCRLEMSIRGPAGEKWRYHASVGVFRAGAPVLIEPLLSSDFLTPDAWRSNLADKPVNEYLAPASNPPSYDRGEGCEQRVDAETAPRDLMSMAPWDLGNLMIDCAYMRRYLLDSPLYDPAREDRLIARTYELIQALRERSLLDETSGVPEADEALRHLRSGPWCPPPVPEK